MRHERVTVIGAGLAGSEAAWQILKRGVAVDLFEMRPDVMTGAHKSGDFAELVCSNSLGSVAPHTASQLLKEELETLDSLVLSVARDTAVPAGSSLAVDRALFSRQITERLSSQANLRLLRTEVVAIPPSTVTIVASGPLTSAALASELSRIVGARFLYFYDAISPIVAADSLNLSRMFFANRYQQGTSDDFLNIPLTRQEYERFVDLLLSGEVVLQHDFEAEQYFECCLPIETLAARGKNTLAFGPMKPVGLIDPKTGERPYAAIQLRAENTHRSSYNLVGFQTKLRYDEQRRILRTLPGLEQAEFLRLGSMHRNTFLDSPKLLEPSLQLKNQPNLLVAGQLTGTEGYLESVATGLIAGINASRMIRGLKPVNLPVQSMVGSLISYITDQSRNCFQPINSNFGLLPLTPDERGLGKSARRQMLCSKAILHLREWASHCACLENAPTPA